MSVPSPVGVRVTVAALLTLTAVTGLVDAVTYLRMGHVFAANMTGNVVFLGFGVVPGSGVGAVPSLVGIAGFVIGAFAGGRLGVRLDGRVHVWLGTAFGVQAAALGVLAALVGAGVLATRGGADLVLVGLLSAAFGLQNATVRRLGVPDLTTTVLTLTLTGLAADNRLAGGRGAQPHRRLGSVAAMLGGAVVGALLLPVSFAGVLGVAAAVLAGVALTFLLRPGARGRRALAGSTSVRG